MQVEVHDLRYGLAVATRRASRKRNCQSWPRMIANYMTVIEAIDWLDSPAFAALCNALDICPDQTRTRILVLAAVEDPIRLVAMRRDAAEGVERCLNLQIHSNKH